MAEVIVDGVRYVPERKRHAKQLPFCELMKNARKARRESLEDVAIAVGSAKAYIWELERGSSQPTLPLLQRIVRYLNIDFDEIATRKEDSGG